jgi:hypothetical protein
VHACQAVYASTCVSSLQINLNLYNGTINCNSPNVLTHVLETVKASDWYAHAVSLSVPATAMLTRGVACGDRSSTTLTYNAANSIPIYGSITFTGTDANGYQTGPSGYARSAHACVDVGGRLTG